MNNLYNQQFGMDAEIQRPRMANSFPTTSRHPCRNDGFFGLAGLVYNGKRRAMEFPVWG